MKHALLLLFPAFALLLGACKKEEEDPPPPDDPEPPAFTLTLNGSQGVQLLMNGSMVTIGEADMIVPFYQEDGVINDPPVPSTRFYGAGLYNATADWTAFLMQIGTLAFEGPSVNPEDFWNFFNTGARPYSPVGTLNGVELAWTDETGTVWSTRCGSGIQSGSVFTITEVATSEDKLGRIARILATFNCKMYNCSTGEGREVSSGMLVLEFRDF